MAETTNVLNPGLTDRKFKLEKAKSEASLLKAQPSFPNVYHHMLLVKSLNPELAQLPINLNFSASIPIELKEIPAKKSSDKDDDDEVSMSKDDDDNADNEDDDDNEHTKSNNDGDDFVHPKFSTYDEEVRQDEEDKEEECLDLRVHTPCHFESTDDEAYDKVTQGDNVEEEKLDEEKTNGKEEVNEMYNDVNINLEGRDIEMTNALLANVQAIQVIEDTHVIITAVTPEVQQQSSFVSSGFISKMFNPNPDTDDFSEFKQTNLFAEAVSLIPGIVDKYLANQMNEAVKVAVQLQSDRLRDKAQAENEDFINKINENIKKIIKEQVKVQVKEQVSKFLPRIEKSVNEQLEAEVLIRSSKEANTSYAVATNLCELELKKILIDKMENNKSIDRSVQQITLYKALVDAYETNKDILATYGVTVTFKRRRDDEDEDDKPSAGSNQGSKIRKAGKEHESTSAPKDKTSKSTDSSKEGSKSITGSTNKSAQAEEQVHTNEDPRESFNELMDTPLDFSAFVLNRLKVDTLTLELLAGLTFELMNGSCKSLVELEYFLEEIYKATTDQLDWNNPKGQQYPHDLRKPLPLIPNSRGRRVIPFDHFINNDLAYLSGGVSSQTYATSVTKTKAANYGYIKWIEDLVPNSIWNPVPIIYDKHMLGSEI
ncbi:hypothetical protein Tco_0606121 [Tanacetum coccineum]